jgi:hypothetical protein
LETGQTLHGTVDALLPKTADVLLASVGDGDHSELERFCNADDASNGPRVDEGFPIFVKVVTARQDEIEGGPGGSLQSLTLSDHTVDERLPSFRAAWGSLNRKIGVSPVMGVDGSNAPVEQRVLADLREARAGPEVRLINVLGGAAGPVNENDVGDRRADESGHPIRVNPVNGRVRLEAKELLLIAGGVLPAMG